MLSRNLIRAAQLTQSGAQLRIGTSGAASLRSSLSTNSQAYRWRLHVLQPAVRYYSQTSAEQTETTKSESSPAPAPVPESNSNSASETVQQQIEAKTKEIIDLKDKYLRSVAEFRNLQERTKREVQSARDYALQKFVKDLLSSIDNLDHAILSLSADKLSSPPSSSATVETVHQDMVNLHQGLQMTENALLSTLKRHGVERYDPAQESAKFDPNLHDAVFMAPQPELQDGTVFQTQQKGFLLNGRVIRAARVGVVKNV